MSEQIKEKIKVIKLKNKYLYNLDIYYYVENYLMNGKELTKTFCRDWYVSEDRPIKLQRKETVKINERWELKDKDLYNETIPLVVDEHTKEKYQALIKSDLYSYTYEEKEVLEDIELEQIDYMEINEDIPFEHEEIFRTSDGWYSKEVKSYLINNIEYSIADNCLIPSPIKELTKPCVLSRENLYTILVDYIHRNIDRNVAEITSEYSFCIRIENVKTKRRIIEWENDYDKRYTLYSLHANNFKELVEKLEKMKKGVIDYINNKHVCPHCGGSGFSSEELDLEKFY